MKEKFDKGREKITMPEERPEESRQDFPEPVSRSFAFDDDFFDQDVTEESEWNPEFAHYEFDSKRVTDPSPAEKNSEFYSDVFDSINDELSQIETEENAERDAATAPQSDAPVKGQNTLSYDEIRSRFKKKEKPKEPAPQQAEGGRAGRPSAFALHSELELGDDEDWAAELPAAAAEGSNQTDDFLTLDALEQNDREDWVVEYPTAAAEEPTQNAQPRVVQEQPVGFLIPDDTESDDGMEWMVEYPAMTVKKPTPAAVPPSAGNQAPRFSLMDDLTFDDNDGWMDDLPMPEQNDGEKETSETPAETAEEPAAIAEETGAEGRMDDLPMPEQNAGEKEPTEPPAAAAEEPTDVERWIDNFLSADTSEQKNNEEPAAEPIAEPADGEDGTESFSILSDLELSDEDLLEDLPAMPLSRQPEPPAPEEAALPEPEAVTEQTEEEPLATDEAGAAEESADEFLTLDALEQNENADWSVEDPPLQEEPMTPPAEDEAEAVSEPTTEFSMAMAQEPAISPAEETPRGFSLSDEDWADEYASQPLREETPPLMSAASMNIRFNTENEGENEDLLTQQPDPGEEVGEEDIALRETAREQVAEFYGDGEEPPEIMAPYSARKGNFFTRNIIPVKGDTVPEMIRKFVMLIAILAVLGSAGYLFNDYVITPYRTENQIEELGEMIDENNMNVIQEEEKIKAYPNVDFPGGMLEKYAALYARNPDFVGWLSIDAFDISLPVVQAEDNNKYLKLDFDGKRSKYGSLFVNASNNMRDLDMNTTIFGHNMKDMSMLSRVINYQNAKGYKKAPVIQFNTLYGQYKWKVFAVFITNGSESGDRGYMFNYMFANLSSESALESYLGEIKQRSLYYPEVDIALTDKILTLSTCTYEFDDARLVVLARMVRPGETAAVSGKVFVNENPRYPQAYYDKRKLNNPYYYAEQWYPS